MFVKLVTDAGVEGIGEVYAATFAPDTVAHMIEDVCERHVVGRDPGDHAHLARGLRPRLLRSAPISRSSGVLSGIELACWDIVGKELDRPVHALLGGKVRERLRSYTYLYPEDGDAADVYTDPALAAERAVAYVKQGFTAVKFDPTRTVRVARSAAALARRARPN